MCPAIRRVLRSRTQLGGCFLAFFGFFCFQRRCGYAALNPDYSRAGLSPSEESLYATCLRGNSLGFFRVIEANSTFLQPNSPLPEFYATIQGLGEPGR